MRNIIITALCIVFLSFSAISQDDIMRILIPGTGGPWSDQEQLEILKYYQDSTISFSWMDVEKTKWRKTDLSGYDIIWLHQGNPDSHGYSPTFCEALLAYTSEGGSILLTQHALAFLNESGLETVAVEHRMKESQDNGYGRMLGFHAFRDHPLFDGLNGGAYVWKPPHDTTVSQCGFFEDAVSQHGKVVAVDWDYIFVRESSKLIVEYEHGEGKILGIGAYFNQM